MTRPAPARVAAAAAVAGYLTGACVLVLATLRDNRSDTVVGAVATIALTQPTFWLGLLLCRRRPDNPTGPALLALGAAVVMTSAVEDWGGTFATDRPWPGSQLAATIAPGVWVFNLAGFFLLCLVFPHGRPVGRGWRVLPWLGLAAAVLVDLVVSTAPENFRAAGGVLPGDTPLPWREPVRTVVTLAVGIALLAVLGAGVAALVLRSRRGDDTTRQQVRWMAAGAGSVPLLLAAGWVLEAFGAPVIVAYVGFLAAMLVLLPAAVTIAVLRHDLLDIDRLLGDSVAWVITTAVAGGVFAVLVAATAGTALRDSGVGAVGAAFLVAVAFLPAHRVLRRAVGRVVDRDRTVGVTSMRGFVRRVRDGQEPAERVEAQLRTALGDPTLRVLLRLPGTDGFVDVDGNAEPPPTTPTIPMRSDTSEVGVVVPGRTSARQLRRTRELLVEARMPIEVTRLQVQLRAALQDARASRTRLVVAASAERRRLERDLHDGAQQRIVTVGMRLRSIQRTHVIGPDTHAELDVAVGALEAVVTELRRLAQGVRPRGLDDGLEAAVRSLTSDSPIPVTVDIPASPPAAPAMSEPEMTTAYFVIAEALTNTLKHARATSAHVSCRSTAAGGHVVEVRDDGVGGVTADLTALRDRVAALGGRLDVTSPVGHGTVLRAEL